MLWSMKQASRNTKARVLVLQTAAACLFACLLACLPRGASANRPVVTWGTSSMWSGVPTGRRVGGERWARCLSAAPGISKANERPVSSSRSSRGVTRSKIAVPGHRGPWWPCRSRRQARRHDRRRWSFVQAPKLFQFLCRNEALKKLTTRSRQAHAASESTGFSACGYPAIRKQYLWSTQILSRRLAGWGRDIG